MGLGQLFEIEAKEGSSLPDELGLGEPIRDVAPISPTAPRVSGLKHRTATQSANHRDPLQYTIANDLHAIEKAFGRNRKAHLGATLDACYKAGPCEFGTVLLTLSGRRPFASSDRVFGYALHECR